MNGVDLIRHLNALAGQHGVGRVDHVENDWWASSPEVYETPAAVTLHAAHKALETLTLSKDQARLKAQIAQQYADMVYNGLWFTHHRLDMDSYVRSTQRYRHRATSGLGCTRAPARWRAAALRRLFTIQSGHLRPGRPVRPFCRRRLHRHFGLPVRTQNQAQGRLVRGVSNGRSNDLGGD